MKRNFYTGFPTGEDGLQGGLSGRMGEVHMNVDLIFKIAAVGILVTVITMLLNSSERKEQALLVSIAGLVVVLVIIVQQISQLFNMIKDLFGF